jgi:hypothetical protein
MRSREPTSLPLDQTGDISMTSTAIVQAEIERFLRSSEPEVLCITGDWGVGKTYTFECRRHLRVVVKVIIDIVEVASRLRRGGARSGLQLRVGD